MMYRINNVCEVNLVGEESAVLRAGGNAKRFHCVRQESYDTKRISLCTSLTMNLRGGITA